MFDKLFDLKVVTAFYEGHFCHCAIVLDGYAWFFLSSKRMEKYVTVFFHKKSTYLGTYYDYQF